MISENDSKTISSLRFPLAVMVVAIHSFITIKGWDYDCIATQGTGSNVAAFFMILFSHVLCHIAVPSFFLISGYLFFSNFGTGNIDIWKKKIGSRIHSLLFPFLIWITLYILYLILLDYKSITSDGLFAWIQSKGGWEMFWCSNSWNIDRVDLWGQPAIATSPILVPFWFIRDLVVCIAISPLFFLLFKCGGQNGVKILGLVFFSFFYFTQTSLLIPGFSSLAFFYFGLGAALALSNRELTSLLHNYRIPIWILFTILFIIEVGLDGHNTSVGNILYPFYVFLGVATFISIVSGKNLGGQEYTFFIFALHYFLLPFVSLGLSKVICILSGETNIDTLYFADKYPYLVVTEYCMKIIITVLTCIGLYTVMQKMSPKLVKVLCGR